MVKIISSATSTEKFAIQDGDKITDLTEAMRYVDKRRPDTLYYHLPDNSANRHYIAADKLKDGLVLEYKESKPTGPRSNVEKHPLEYYMNEDELALYNEIVEKAKAGKAEAEKPRELTALEKAQKEVERLNALIAKLSAE